jgi:hypothetical protein
MPQMESARGLSKLEKNIAQTTGRTIREKLAEVRPALSILKQEAPRLKVDAAKLHDVDAEFNQTVDEVNKTFEEFELIVRSDDRTKIAARASIVVPWLIAVLITGIALSGVFLNFFLIERPMSEIVGQGSKIAGIGLPAFAAMIVIFLEFVAGIVLMDALGFTKLIPAFHTMPDSGRKILLIGALVFLSAFSVLEAFLAIVREQIIEQQNEISRIAVSSLGGAAAAAPSDVVASTIPTAKVAGIGLPTFAQIILAVVIPWLLATAALPLETIVRNSVFMVSIVVSYALLTLGFIFKSLGAPFRAISALFGGGRDRSDQADKAEERAARKAAKKNKKDDDEGQGRNRKEDDLMVFEELPQEDVQPNRRDKRQRELQRA